MQTEDTVPPELRVPNYRTTELDGIGYDPQIDRQDPSNVMRVGDLYYVWYSQRPSGTQAFASAIYYATSRDGRKWDDRGEALGKGDAGAWDSFGVFTPYVATTGGDYYLYYTATSAAEAFDVERTLRHIGVAVAASPDGPERARRVRPVRSGRLHRHGIRQGHLLGRGRALD